MSLVVAMLARKGGVSKTTTVLNLAGAALNDGAKRVVVIDMDSQCTLSKALLGPHVVEQLRLDATVHAVAERTKSAGDVARETSVPGLLIVPSHPELRVPADGALHLSGVDADLMLIDTPPDVRDSSIRCALMAAHTVVSPVVPESWGLQSVPAVQTLLMGTGIVSNQRLIFAGWLLSMVQRVGMHGVCEDTMRRLHGATVFDTIIPASVVFKEASAAGLPVTHYAPKSAAAKAVRTCFDELLERVQKHIERKAA